MGKTSAAAVQRYEAKAYDKVLLRMKKGQRDQIKAAADAAGESVNAYIMAAVSARMEQEQPAQPEA